MNIPNVFLGGIYEAEFEAEALRRGFVTHRPTLPVAWDFLVTSPKGILKVQVKGTGSKSTEPGAVPYTHPTLPTHRYRDDSERRV